MDTTELPPDFKEFLQLLDAEKVEYLLVGGYAVGVHGFSRGTGDLDIWVAISEQNARSLVRALRRFGFSQQAVSETLFLEEHQIVTMGHPPLRIDLMTSVSGIDFREAYQQHEVRLIDGVRVRVIGRNHLMENKRAAGRSKDKHDIEELGKQCE
jgi:hypothetical protein